MYRFAALPAFGLTVYFSFIRLSLEPQADVKTGLLNSFIKVPGFYPLY